MTDPEALRRFSQSLSEQLGTSVLVAQAETDEAGTLSHIAWTAVSPAEVEAILQTGLRILANDTAKSADTCPNCAEIHRRAAAAAAILAENGEGVRILPDLTPQGCC